MYTCAFSFCGSSECLSLFLCKTWCVSKMLVHSMLWFLGTDNKSIKVITVRSFWMRDAKGNLIVLGNEFQLWLFFNPTRQFNHIMWIMVSLKISHKMSLHSIVCPCAMPGFSATNTTLPVPLPPTMSRAIGARGVILLIILPQADANWCFVRFCTLTACAVWFLVLHFTGHKWTQH